MVGIIMKLWQDNRLWNEWETLCYMYFNIFYVPSSVCLSLCVPSSTRLWFWSVSIRSHVAPHQLKVVQMSLDPSTLSTSYPCLLGN